jgi:hypothetical protein
LHATPYTRPNKRKGYMEGDRELPGASAAAGGGKARLNRAEEIMLNAHQTRHARRFYISGFPPDVDEAEITSFFNEAFNTVRGEARAYP